MFDNDEEQPDPDGLRYYQRDASEAAIKSLRTHRACLLVLATGLGKTQIAGAIARAWPGNILFLAHRDELVTQAQARLEAMTGEWTEREQGTRASYHARIVVGSVQSVMQSRRLQRMGSAKFSLIIVDECFPAGTMVDGRPIESLRVGDLVTSVDHNTGAVVRRRVVRLFEKVSTSMVRLCYGESVVECTGNHPVFVKGRGYVKAECVDAGDMLCMRGSVRVREADLDSAEKDMQPKVSGGAGVDAHGADKPQALFGAHEVQQPDAPGGQQGAGEGYADSDGAQAAGAWRERKGSDDSRVGDCRGVGVANERRGADEDAARVGISDLLQDRCGEPVPKGWGGGRWSEPRDAGSADAGPEEGGLLAWVRLDRIESIQPASASGTRVYNVEVEGSHTYFANDILVHNCHHYSAKSFRKPLDYFKGAKVLGITATPDRADKMALGQIFDDAPFRMDIVEGIEAGYLVPLECSRVHLDAISLDSVGKSKGDLNTGELDTIMVEACEGIAQTLTGLHPGKQAIVFMPGIRSSEYVAAKLNVLVPGSAVCISSESELVERAEQVKAFKEGKILYFCNCGIATEGFDAPDVSIIAIGRPTLSRSLYAQMVGRGTRPKAGTVDRFLGADGAEKRRAAIAASAKPRGIILDFVGVGEKHDLASPEDLLGGDYTPAEIKLAKAKAAKEPGELVEKNLAVARAELQAIAAAIRAKVQSRILRFDPFGVMREQSAPGRYDELSRDVLKPDAGLVEYLKRAGLKPKEIAGMSELQARRFRAAAVERQRKGLASYRQLRQLERHGFTDANVSMAKAKAAMDYMDSLGWDHSAVDHSRLATILGTQPRPQPEGAP